MSIGGEVRRRERLLWPVVSALMALAVLIGLGTWQLERKSWKENLIATLDQRLGAPPVALPQRSEWSDLDRSHNEFRRVAVHAEFLRGKEGRVYTAGSGLRADIKGPGYFAFAPARLADGSIVVVDRGYVPNPRPDAAVRPIGLSEGAVDIVGVVRWPEQPGMFVTPHNASQDLWFVRDPTAMARFYQWGEVAPFYIDQELPIPAGGMPRPGPLTVNLRNEHLGYALTWYGLAVVLVLVFAFWIRGRRGEINASTTQSR